MDAPTKQGDSNPSAPPKERNSPLYLFFKDAGLVFKNDELGREVANIAMPAAMALAADPVASLVDTAFIGNIGPVELAAVGISIAIFNQVSRICIFPLVSVTTSFVAEDAARSESSQGQESANGEKPQSTENETKDLNAPDSEKTEEARSLLPGKNQTQEKSRYEKKHIPSVSSALVIGGVLGLLQAVMLTLAAKPVLNFMGVHSDSPMLRPAQQYLTLRSLGAPAVLLSLAMQGVFRGFKDTKTPLYATVVGDAANIVLDPIFMFGFGLGVSGAAIAHVTSQYLISLILLWKLMEKVEILPPRFKDLQFARFLKNGSLLLARVVAATCCVTLSASLAARQGSICMAAFQICLQIWLTTSLLADGLAVSAQAILASAFAKKDYEKAFNVTSRVLQMSVVMGMSLTLFLGISLQFAWRLFTRDVEVKRLIRIGIPFVAGTQPINTLAFVFDGINFGASDFPYSAYSMVFVAVVSIGFLLYLSNYGFIGIWTALTLYMALRMTAGFGRVGTATGPWSFLRSM